MDYLKIFLISGLLGWVILSLFNGEPSGFLWENFGIPFKPMFAIGAIIIYYLVPYLKDKSILEQFIFYFICLTIIEFLLFELVKLFNVNFQCYYNGKRIALIYSIYWGLAGTILTQLFIKKYWKHVMMLSLILFTIIILFRDGRLGYIQLDKHPKKIIYC